MEAEISSSYSQNTAILEPFEHSPHLHTLFSTFNLHIILLSTPRFPKRSGSRKLSDQNYLCISHFLHAAPISSFIWSP